MRQRDGAGHGTPQRQFAETLRHGSPCARRAGYRDRQRTILRHALMPRCVQFIDGDCARCSSAGVQTVQFALVPDQCEGIATDTIGGRLNDGQRSSGGDCRINGIAAGLQHRQPGLRSQRLRGGYHAAFGIYRATAGGIGIMIRVEGEHVFSHR